MSLIEVFSTAATGAERRDEPSQRVSVLLTAIVVTGIAAVTLGWIALLARGAVWLIRG
jgi:hypothetical protein